MPLKSNRWVNAALLLLCSIACALGLVHSTQANSAPPPRRIWFVFEGGALPSALQVLGCSDAACTQINLLNEYGRCESADCIDTPQTLTAPTDYFDCAEGRCLFSTYAELPPYLKLTGQFVADDRSSAPFPIEASERWSMTVLHTSSNGTMLVLTPQPDANIEVGWLGKFLPWLLPSGLLTLGIESLVIAALLLFVLKKPMNSIVQWVTIIITANVLSYPATWLFFPTLSYWSIPSERLLGVLAILLAMLLAALIIAFRHAQRRSLRIALGVIVGVVAVLGCIGSVSVLAIAGYGQYLLGPAAGMSFRLMLVLAELFAIAFETLVIYWLSKRELSFLLTFFLILAANAASFGMGLLAFSPYALR